MDGPAEVRDPFAKKEDVASDVEEEVTECDEGDDSEIVTCEEIIGLDEVHVGDPLSQLVVLQSRVMSLHKERDKLVQRQLRRAAKSEASVEDDVAINAGVEQCRQHFVEMQAVIRKMTGGNLDAMTALDREEANDVSSNASREEAAAARFKRRVLRHDPESAENQRRNDDAVMSAMKAARSSGSSAVADANAEASSNLHVGLQEMKEVFNI